MRALSLAALVVACAPRPAPSPSRPPRDPVSVARLSTPDAPIPDLSCLPDRPPDRDVALSFALASPVAIAGDDAVHRRGGSAVRDTAERACAEAITSAVAELDALCVGELGARGIAAHSIASERCSCSGADHDQMLCAVLVDAACQGAGPTVVVDLGRHSTRGAANTYARARAKRRCVERGQTLRRVDTACHCEPLDITQRPVAIGPDACVCLAQASCDP